MCISAKPCTSHGLLQPTHTHTHRNARSPCWHSTTRSSMAACGRLLHANPIIMPTNVPDNLSHVGYRPATSGASSAAEPKCPPPASNQTSTSKRLLPLVRWPNQNPPESVNQFVINILNLCTFSSIDPPTAAKQSWWNKKIDGLRRCQHWLGLRNIKCPADLNALTHGI